MSDLGGHTGQRNKVNKQLATNGDDKNHRGLENAFFQRVIDAGQVQTAQQKTKDQGCRRTYACGFSWGKQACVNPTNNHDKKRDNCPAIAQRFHPVNAGDFLLRNGRVLWAGTDPNVDHKKIGDK